MQEQIYCRHDLKLKKVIAAFTFEAGMKLNAAFNAIISLLLVDSANVTGTG